MCFSLVFVAEGTQWDLNRLPPGYSRSPPAAHRARAELPAAAEVPAGVPVRPSVLG